MTSDASLYTKFTLEALHENIVVVRHSYQMDPVSASLKLEHDTRLGNLTDSRVYEPTNLSSPAKKYLPTTKVFTNDPEVDWCNHEKLCVVDRTIAFMGGVDICFGRWDINSYPIALEFNC